jgi:glutathione peroxidase
MSIYNCSISSIDGQENFMEQFKGKVTLITNTVSKYGYTPQCSVFWSYARTLRRFWQLQKVHDEFKDKGFSVVGVPCNQFAQGLMESGSNEEISSFIKKAYPFVNFPFTEKLEVNGPNESEIYSILKGKEKRIISDNMADQSALAQEGWNQEGQALARIPHSWEQFVVGRSGSVISRFNWQSMPLDHTPLTTGESWTLRECISELL